MFLVDSHCHLHYEDFLNKDQLNTILEQCYSVGIRFLMNVATKGGESSDFIKKNFKKSTSNIYNWQEKINIMFSTGFHPNEDYAIDEESLYNMSFDEIDSGIITTSAIGECGFDISPTSCSLDLQEANFEKQLRVARRLNVPVIIHCRDAWQPLFKSMDRNKDLVYIIHCFTGDSAVAEHLINNYNCYISLSGIVTYKPKDLLAPREALQCIPLERMLIETDTPFLIPYMQRKQGNKYNYPHFIKETLEKIAEAKNVKAELVADFTTRNFLKIFNLSSDLLV